MQLTQQTDVGVVSDLYQAGYSDDGHPYIAECYHVEVTLPDGRRFRHFSSFPGCVAEYSEEGDRCFGDIREQQRARAERLVARVLAAGVIDDDIWHEVDPAYGSNAYISQGIELERAYADRFAD